jgi:DNA-binding transcriptional ArsR family regulator
MAQQSIECAGTPLDVASAAVGIGLSHPIRVAILRLLADRGELCSCEIEPRFNVDPSGVSRHLSALRDAGLVVSRRDGVRILHRLASPSVVKLISLADRIAANAEAAREVRRQSRTLQYQSEVKRRVSLERR